MIHLNRYRSAAYILTPRSPRLKHSANDGRRVFASPGVRMATSSPSAGEANQEGAQIFAFRES
jgi:hypothetical protein